MLKRKQLSILLASVGDSRTSLCVCVCVRARVLSTHTFHPPNSQVASFVVVLWISSCAKFKPSPDAIMTLACFGLHSLLLLKCPPQEFSGGPVVKDSTLQCKGCGLDPWLENCHSSPRCRATKPTCHNYWACQMMQSNKEFFFTSALHQIRMPFLSLPDRIGYALHHLF